MGDQKIIKSNNKIRIVLRDTIFEVGMVTSEFTDSGEYAKYDFQRGEWEVWE